MATAAPTGMNPAYLLDPSLYGDQQAVAQQQALAQALMSQGISPMPETQMAGNVALRNSPTQSIAKLVQILSGQDLQKQANLGGQALMQRQAQAIMPMFQPQVSGLPPQQAALAAGGQGPTQAAAQSAQTMPGQTVTPGPWTIPGSTGQASLSAYLLNPEKFGETFAGGLAPNDTTKMAMQGGMDPMAANRLALLKTQTDPKVFAMKQAGMSDAQILAATQGEAAKNAEISRRSGEQYVNGYLGDSGIIPKLPDGVNLTGPVGPNGVIPGVTPVPGVQPVIKGNAAAGVAGTNTQSPTVAYGPDGKPIYSTKAQDVQRANMVAPSTQATRDAESAQILDNEIAKETDPATRAALVRERARINVSPEQAPGVVTGANDAQKQLGERYTALRDTVSTAQTTNSYLDNIKQLSGPAATGKFSDKLDYANALLAPFSVRANDAKTANDLLNKYSNQIVARLSTGGLGTDAARTILGSAYPNAHMTKEAIGEAVDNIKAVNSMQSAKLSYLSEAGNKRDTTAYQQREQQFDQTADPRVFQLANMSDREGAAFLAKMPKPVKDDLVRRAQALKQMGAL